jgi:hypothetical protein
VKNGLFQGKGKIIDAQTKETKEEGLFEKGRLVEGRVSNFQWNSKIFYTGGIKEGKFNGSGEVRDLNGKVLEKGVFERGRLKE